MSDCRNGGRDVPCGVIRGTANMSDGNAIPISFTADNGRTVESFAVDGQEYAPVRECERVQTHHVAIAGFDNAYNDGYECSECGGEMFEDDRYCKSCGAVVA